MNEAITRARQRAEKSLGVAIPDDTAERVLLYAKRKCEMAGQPEGYLPLLYETELTDHFMREAINARSELLRKRA